MNYPFGKAIKVSAEKTDELLKPIVIKSVEKPIDQSVIKIAKREAIMWDTKQINDYALAIEEMGYEIAKKTLLYIQDDLKIINL